MDSEDQKSLTEMLEEWARLEERLFGPLEPYADVIVAKEHGTLTAEEKNFIESYIFHRSRVLEGEFFCGMNSFIRMLPELKAVGLHQAVSAIEAMKPLREAVYSSEDPGRCLEEHRLEIESVERSAGDPDEITAQLLEYARKHFETP